MTGVLQWSQTRAKSSNSCRELAATCRSPSNQPFIPVLSPAFPAFLHPIRLIARQCGPNPRYLTNTLSIPSSKNSQKHHDSAQKQRQVSGNFGRVGELRFCRGPSNLAFVQQYRQVARPFARKNPSLSTNTPVRPSWFDGTPPVSCSKNPQKPLQIGQKLRQFRGNFGRFRELPFCRGPSNATFSERYRQVSDRFRAKYPSVSTNTPLTSSYYANTSSNACSNNR